MLKYLSRMSKDSADYKALIQLIDELMTCEDPLPITEERLVDVEQAANPEIIDEDEQEFAKLKLLVDRFQRHRHTSSCLRTVCGGEEDEAPAAPAFQQSAVNDCDFLGEVDSSGDEDDEYIGRRGAPSAQQQPTHPQPTVRTRPEKVCRYGFPKPPMPFTTILEPIAFASYDKKISKDLVERAKVDSFVVQRALKKMVTQHNRARKNQLPVEPLALATFWIS